MKRVFPVFTFFAGVYWLVNGISIGLWVNNRIGGGLVPMIGGILAIIFSLIVFFAKPKAERLPQNNTEEKSDDSAREEEEISATQKETNSAFDYRVLLPLLAAVLVPFLSKLTGLVIALGLFIFLWMFVYEKSKWYTSLITAVITALAVYLVFEVWLQVRFEDPVFFR